MTKYYTYIYPEIYKRNELGQEPEYPKACPACGAKTKSPEFDHYDGPVYECGGQYTFKPQIQNHTNKWWGTCPIEREKERKRSGRVCNGCGEKRLEGTGFPIDVFGWTCTACGHDHPRIKRRTKNDRTK
jgi:hypothetical protein